ncbi:MAG: type II secretion system F family protein [Candidatus Woesearchaeota archaeon]
MGAASIVSSWFPFLKTSLQEAGTGETSQEYVKKVLATSLIVSLIVELSLLMLFKSANALFAFPLVFAMLFFYFLGFVRISIVKLNRSIDREIVFAGRFLIIELESGVPMLNAFENLAKNYRYAGAYFREITDKVMLGTPINDAIKETVDRCASPNLKRMLWQLLNSLNTGSDVSGSLSRIVEQVAREQEIAVREYGRKLNPLAMLYMIVSIIIPSLGTTMLIVLSLFLGLAIPFGMLMIIALFIVFLQFMFLSVIRNSRPPMMI